MAFEILEPEEAKDKGFEVLEPEQPIGGFEVLEEEDPTFAESISKEPTPFAPSVTPGILATQRPEFISKIARRGVTAIREAFQEPGAAFRGVVKGLEGPEGQPVFIGTAGEPATLTAPSVVREEEVTPAAVRTRKRFEEAVPFAAKVAAGVGFSALIPGAGLSSVVLRSLAAELPFTVDFLSKDRRKEAALGAGLSLGIDLLTRGVGKSIRLSRVTDKLVKEGIDPSSARKIASEINENVTEEQIKRTGQSFRENVLGETVEESEKGISMALRKDRGGVLIQDTPDKDLIIPQIQGTTDAIARNVDNTEKLKGIVDNPVSDAPIAAEFIDKNTPSLTGREAIEEAVIPDAPATKIGEIAQNTFASFRDMFETNRSFLKRTGPTGATLANRFDEVDFRARGLSGGAILTVAKKIEGIDRQTNDLVLDLLDPSFAQREGRVVIPTEKAQDIAQTIRVELDKAQRFAVDSNVKEKVGDELVTTKFRDNYIPYNKDALIIRDANRELATYEKTGDVGDRLQEGIDWLVKTDQAEDPIEALAKIAAQVGNKRKPLITRLSKRLSVEKGIDEKQASSFLSSTFDDSHDPFFGSLERARSEIQLPSNWYNRDVQTLIPNYLNNAYRRSLLSQAFPDPNNKGITNFLKENRAAMESEMADRGIKNTSKTFKDIEELTESVMEDRDFDSIGLFPFLQRWAGKILVGWNPTSPPANIARGIYQQLLLARPTDIGFGLIKSFKQANKEEALKAGALGLDVSRAVSRNLGQDLVPDHIIPKGIFNTTWNWIKTPIQQIKRGPFIEFQKFGESFVRTGAFFSTQKYANDLAKKAFGKPGDLGFINKTFRTLPVGKAKKALGRMGITEKDFVNGSLTPEGLRRAGIFGADKTQGVTGKLDMPRFANHEAGRLMLTLNRMTFRLTDELTQQVKARNWRAISSYLVGAGLVESQIAEIRNNIYRRNDPNYKATRKTEMAWWQLASNVGLMYGVLAESVISGELPNAALVIPSKTFKIGKALVEGDLDKAAKELTKTIPAIRAWRGK